MTVMLRILTIGTSDASRELLNIIVGIIYRPLNVMNVRTLTYAKGGAEVAAHYVLEGGPKVV